MDFFDSLFGGIRSVGEFVTDGFSSVGEFIGDTGAALGQIPLVNQYARTKLANELDLPPPRRSVSGPHLPAQPVMNRPGIPNTGDGGKTQFGGAPESPGQRGATGAVGGGSGGIVNGGGGGGAVLEEKPKQC